MSNTILLCTLALLGLTSARPPNVVFFVFDDLGFDDLSFFNGNRTSTPHLDGLLAEGVQLSRYHTFKVCSPSRASIHTGRMPFNIGYYSMEEDENKNTTGYRMLPALMKDAGYYTAAFGKWDIGYIKEELTPTFRGYDESLMYYEAALADVWTHAAPETVRCRVDGKPATWPHGLPVDLANATAAGGIRAADPSLNGTYDSEVFTNAAVSVVERHAASNPTQPLFLYIAYRDVHAAAPQNQSVGPIQAPCPAVNKFSTTVNDTYKAQAGMLYEMDRGVGDVVRALKATGLYDDTLIAFVSDNGGPLPHSTNAPRRGGKHTFWDGGVNVVGALSGPMVPESIRGSTWDGLAHSSDWVPTLVEGVAGHPLPAYTGPMPLDGKNLWGAILANASSPRTEVVHQVSNQFFSENVTAVTAVDSKGTVWKLINGDPGDSRVVGWPAPAAKPVPFGNTGGVSGPLGRCYAQKLPGAKYTHLCKERPCLFNLSQDESEANDLGGDPQYAGVVSDLLAKIQAASDAAPAVPTVYPNTTEFKAAFTRVCQTANVTRSWQPANWSP